MKVKNIRYHPAFIKDIQRLSKEEQTRAIKTAELFQSNPLHPSLRLHALKGKLVGSWSISVTMKIRIIFKRVEDGGVVFYSIGRHDIYQAQ